MNLFAETLNVQRATLKKDRTSALRGERSALGVPYSHSMVAGGLELMSKTTRLMPRTSLMMRFEMRASVSYGTRV